MNLRHWLDNKPFTLALSSGFFGFFAHTGFAKALEEKGYHAQGYAGASAGAIVAGALAGGMSAKELEKIMISIKLKDFWDPAIGFGLLRGEKFELLLTHYFGSTFQHLTKPLRIATFNIAKKKTETFTAGNLAKTIRASAALPLMFQPVRIQGRLYWDGGILDKMALNEIPSEENVLSHFLQGKNFLDKYERMNAERKISPSTKLISLKKLPRSGPHKLHIGPSIIESAYRQTLELLK